MATPSGDIICMCCWKRTSETYSKGHVRDCTSPKTHMI
nr:MAG TPA: hypothetical protein [Caudoviricetes sp.]